MRRRTLVPALAAAPLVFAIAPALAESSGPDGLDAALALLHALPGTLSYLVHVGPGGTLGRLSHQPGVRLFTASAFKTFVLGQYLREVERGRFAEDQDLEIDDSVRTIGSPIFERMTGTTIGAGVLQAMMSNSDNTATDTAIAAAGIDSIRSLVRERGLETIQLADSTRIFLSYALGAPAGVDLGWDEINKIATGKIDDPYTPRPLLNDVQTFAGTSRDYVSWYEQVLQGNVFRTEETLNEFKRLQQSSVQIKRAVPANTLAYVKGGEVSPFGDFSVKSFAGQMLIGATPVTFCFMLNWYGTTTREEFEKVEEAFFAAIKAVLTVIKAAILAV